MLEEWGVCWALEKEGGIELDVETELGSSVGHGELKKKRQYVASITVVGYHYNL